MFDTVRARLTAWYVMVLGGVLILFAAGVYGVLARSLYARVDEALLALLDVAATSLAHDAAEGQEPDDAARSTVAELSSRLEELAIHDGQGVLLARSPSRDDPALLWECAAVSVLILLYSPLTWGQHCVGVLPAMYLLVRSWKAGEPPPKFTRAALAVYGLVVLVLNREVVGRTGVYLIDSYHLPTWCLVGVLAAIMLGHGRTEFRIAPE